MGDQIHQAIDVIIPCMSGVNGSEVGDEQDDDDKKLVNISGYETTKRPLYLIRRTKYLKPIREQLKAKNRLLLSAWCTYAYYSCEITEMQQKVLEHMTSTGAYHLIMELESTDHDRTDNHLKAIDERVTSTLNQLSDDQSITWSQWRKMRVSRSRSRLDSLYFLPNTRRVRHRLNPFLFDSFSLNIGECSNATNDELSSRLNN